MQVLRARQAGFCFGVKRAYDLACQKREGEVQTLGELIHNPEVLEELNAKGVRAISAVSKIKTGTVIIRAHGISDKKRQDLKQKNLEIVDASCPFVRRIHDEVAAFTKKNIPVVIVGRRDHPEMRAVVEDFPQVFVCSKVPAKLFQEQGTVAVLAQTTETKDKFEKVVEALRKQGLKVLAVNTICNATTERQQAAVALAKKVDLMLVIGGKKSNNTKQLYELCRKLVKSHWIENEKGLKKIWFKEVKKVGITAGASTPESVIQRVINKVKSL